MYLAIDVGGSKTLLAAFSAEGKILKQTKFPTPKRYSEFLKLLEETTKTGFKDYRFIKACCAVPGVINRERGLALDFGNLPWQDVPIKKDVQAAIGHVPTLIENDANLAGLAEALVHKKYKRVLYLTVSTGIGGGIIANGVIDPNFADSEVGQMMMEYNGKLAKWEDFASGRALVKEFGKRASEIEDAATWREFSRRLARGINELIAVMHPEIIIIGGGVGAHYQKFAPYLEAELKSLENDMVKTPPIIKATHPEEAVIYGCYYLAAS
jgi:predicted NBD/HSP70 family sugar kinase